MTSTVIISLLGFIKLLLLLLLLLSELKLNWQRRYSSNAFLIKQQLTIFVIISCLVLSGHVPSGLRVHPDREYIIYPLGCTIILQRIADGQQEFLHEHRNNISCISVSKSGSYVASGQVSFMGTKVVTTVIHYVKPLTWLIHNLCYLYQLLHVFIFPPL